MMKATVEWLSDVSFSAQSGRMVGIMGARMILPEKLKKKMPVSKNSVKINDLIPFCPAFLEFVTVLLSILIFQIQVPKFF